MELDYLLQQHPLIFYGGITIVGLIVGSFLNVVVHRLPLMLERQWRTQCEELLERGGRAEANPPFNLVVPRSRCPRCGHPIGPLENIPLLSYLIQRGRCRHCDQPISVRYPAVELATALLTLAVAVHFGPTWQTLAAVALTWALIALSAIDFDHQLLPDAITLPFLWIGLLLSLVGPFASPSASIIGAAAGYLSLWAVYHLFRLATGKEGMGHGDFKLVALLGAWFGWQVLPVVILLSSVVGAVVGILLILFLGRDRNVPIPFGPYLAAAGWLAMLWGEELLAGYIRWSGIG